MTTTPTTYKTTEEKVAVRMMRSDPAYQRSLDAAMAKRRIYKIVHEYDAKAIGVFVLSKRKDGLYIVDGQTRHAALLEMGKLDEMVPCVIYHGLTREQEAELFVVLNRERRLTHPIDLFRAQYFMGDPATVEIVKMLNALGYAVGYGTTANANKDSKGNLYVACPGTLEYVYTKGTPDLLAGCLAVLTQAWKTDTSHAISPPLLKGLAYFLYMHQDIDNEHIDVPRLVKKLEGFDPNAIIDRARSSYPKKSLASAVPCVLASLYNTGLRSGRLTVHQPEEYSNCLRFLMMDRMQADGRLFGGQLATGGGPQ